MRRIIIILTANNTMGAGAGTRMDGEENIS
jgi:hypothetical protein